MVTCVIWGGDLKILFCTISDDPNNYYIICLLKVYKGLSKYFHVQQNCSYIRRYHLFLLIKAALCLHDGWMPVAICHLFRFSI